MAVVRGAGHVDPLTHELRHDFGGFGGGGGDDDEGSPAADARNALGVRTIVDDSNVYDHPGRVWARRSPGGANPTQRRVLDVTGELNRPRQSHAQVHGGSYESSSRPQRRSRFRGGTGPTG